MRKEIGGVLPEDYRRREATRIAATRSSAIQVPRSRIRDIAASRLGTEPARNPCRRMPSVPRMVIRIDGWRDEDAPEQILEQFEVPCTRQVNERASVADHPHFTRPSSASNSPSANAKGEIRCRAMNARNSA